MLGMLGKFSYSNVTLLLYFLDTMMSSIGIWGDTHMVLAKVSVIDAASVKQV